MPKGSSVLMADDDKMLIDMYKERLELAGYKVTIARNGEEAIGKVKEIKPDIIMLDIMMPKVNGYEALASIKSDPQTKNIPVIMLSALMRDFNREKAVEAGADDYLIKSEAMPSDVITKIEQVLCKYGKGTTPLPGATPAPNIPTTTAAVPANNVPLPPPVPAPPAPPLPVPQEKTAITPPDKIIFSPEPEAKIDTEPVGLKQPEKEEEVPVVKIQPVASSPSLPTPPPAPKPINQPSLSVLPQKEKSPASVALIVVLAILLTALVNDLVIYYLFFLKK